ncbi:DUF397 domain-containing protein [Streptomyces sp. NPDC088116]|uniref:DUF397 domain-containing protein n=1 Tax=Streptomyces sp. NPDC088116 TaxID=3365825 RepID=UPI003826EB27
MTERSNWRASTYTKSGNCVEVADDGPAGVMVRDTRRDSVGKWQSSPPSGPSSWSSVRPSTPDLANAFGPRLSGGACAVDVGQRRARPAE